MDPSRSSTQPVLFVTIILVLTGSTWSVGASSSLPPFMTLESFDVALNIDNVLTMGTFTGSASISLTIDKVPNSYYVLTLDSEVKILNVDLLVNNKKVPYVRSWNNDKKYNIEFEILSGSNNYVFSLSYEGKVVNQGELGLYVTKDKNVIGTTLYPNAAKKVFPCLEDPKYKIKSSLTVTGLDKFKIIPTFKKNARVSLPSYGLGFIAVSTIYTSYTISDTVIAWGPSNLKQWNTFLSAVKTVNKPFTKNFDCLNIVLVPGLNISSQSYCLIGLRPDFMQEDTTTSVEQLKGIFMATINALGKYLFRIQVTPATWNEFWISDSLSLYLQYAMADEINNGIEDFSGSLTLTEVVRVIMENDSSPVIPASIDPYLLATDSIYKSVYKGAAVLMTLQSGNNVSIESMINDIADFTNEFNGMTANTSDLLGIFTNRSFHDLPDDNNLNLLSKEWLYKPGYPKITISVENGYFKADQESFQGYAMWHIPFSYEITNSIMYKWLIDGSMMVAISETNPLPPVDINVNGDGMFRVSYDSNNWEKLLQLNLSDNNMAAKLDDLFVFSWSTLPKLRIDQFLQVFDQLGENDGYSTWYMALKHFDMLYNTYFELPGFRDKFQEMLSVRFYQVYNKYNNWAASGNNLIFSRLTKRMIIQAACRYNVSSCFSDSIINKGNQNSDLKFISDCTSLLGVNEKTWEAVFNELYIKDSSQYSRADALYSLACPAYIDYENENEIVNNYFDKILNNDVLPEDASRAFSYIYSHPENINQTLTYLMNNFENISKNHGDGLVEEVLYGMAPMLSSSHHQDLLRDLLSNVDSKIHPGIVDAARFALATLDQTIKISWNHMDDISRWLGVNPPSTPVPPTGSPVSPSGGSTNGTTAPPTKPSSAHRVQAVDLWASALLVVSALVLTRL